VLYVNAHAAEPCGKEGTSRFLEDLLIWREKDPNHILDDGVGINGKTHKITVAELLRKTKLYWVNVQSDGWAQGDGTATTARTTTTPARTPIASPTRTAGCTRPQRISPGAATRFSRSPRARRSPSTCVSCASTNSAGGRSPRPTTSTAAAVGAVLLHDQGNDAAKVDRTLDYAARTSSKMDKSSRPTRPRPGLTATQAAAASAGSVRDELFQALQPHHRPADHREGRLPDARVGRVRHRLGAPRLQRERHVGTMGRLAGRSRRDAISFEVDCAAYGDWNPPLYQLFVDNVRAVDETAAVHAPRRPTGSSPSGPTTSRPGRLPRDRRARHDATATRRPHACTTTGNPITPQITQAPYDVSNTDYFRETLALVNQPVVEVPAKSPARLGESVASLVVPDTTDVDPPALKAFAESRRQPGPHRRRAATARPDRRRPEGRVSAGLRVHRLWRPRPQPPVDRRPLQARAPDVRPRRARYPLLMERDQYCRRESGNCEPSPTQNSSPIWTVDRKAGRTRAARRSRPPTRRPTASRASKEARRQDRDRDLKLARAAWSSRRPTAHAHEQYDHWFGLDRTRSRRPASSCCCAR